MSSVIRSARSSPFPPPTQDIASLGNNEPEPALTDDERNEIARKASLKTRIIDEMDGQASYHSQGDRVQDGQEYVNMENGEPFANPKCYLSSMHEQEYQIAVTEARIDHLCRDFVIENVIFYSDHNGWQIPYIVSDGCILEGVDQDKIDTTLLLAAKCIRIGLPRVHFEYMMRCLEATYPGCLRSVLFTPGYFWLIASWGMGTEEWPASFVVKENDRCTVNKDLKSVMYNLNGRGVEGAAQLLFKVKRHISSQDETQVYSSGECDVMVQCHSIIAQRTCAFRGPG